MIPKQKEKQLVSVRDYAEQHNPKRNRRGHKMTESYLYRLIRQHAKEERKDLWFSYVMQGDKDHILIEL